MELTEAMNEAINYMEAKFQNETAFAEIPKFWDEFCKEYCNGGEQELYGMYGVYAVAAGFNVEMYTKGDTESPDYISEIWIPVKKK